MIKRKKVRKAKKTHSFRSNFESLVYEKLCAQQLAPEYEAYKIKYTQPAKARSYNPDFTLFKKDGTVMYLESKGYWPARDREKMKCIKESNPDLDIRIIFMNPNIKISKKSKTTYSTIAEKLGFKWCVISSGLPVDWINDL